jgi:hypothetical protein
MLALLLAALLLPAQEPAPEAPPPPPATLPEENLGEPIRVMRRSGDFLFPKPDGGWYFLTSYNPVGRNTLPLQYALVDLTTGAVRTAKVEPSGAFVEGWHNQGVAARDGNYYLGHYARVGLWRFDPRTAALTYLGHEPLAELRVLPFCMAEAANDGTLFLGTASHKGLLVSFQPATGVWREYGNVGPVQHAPRYVHALAVADDYVYAIAAKNPWYLVAIHRESGQQTILAQGPEITYLTLHGHGADATITITRQAEGQPKSESRHRLTAGALAPYVPPPAAATPPPPKPPKPELLLTRAQPTPEGRAEIWWRLPGETAWRSAVLEGLQTTPWGIARLAALPDGRILAVPEAYESVITYDPATNRFATLGKAPLSAGAIVPVTNDRAYLLGYPGSYVVEAFLDRPWTYFTSTPTYTEPPLTDASSNPRECQRWSTIGVPSHHIREGVLGADGWLYFGAHAERSAVGGSLGWWDPATRTAGGLRDPFLWQDCAGLTAADGGRLIVYSSFPVADPNGRVAKPATGFLYVLDTATRQVVRELLPLPGMDWCGPVLGDGPLVHGAGRDDQGYAYYAVNVLTGETVRHRRLGDRPASPWARLPDGQLYLFAGRDLLRVNPADGEVTPLGTVTEPGPLIAVGEDLYWPAGPRLYRLRQPARLAAP